MLRSPHKFSTSSDINFASLSVVMNRKDSFMAGPGNNPVQVLSTGLRLHWEFLRLRAGFELPSSWSALPCYGADLNRNSFCVMR
jgi:hypothetical protein